MAAVSMKKVDILSACIVIPICIYVFYESSTWPILPDLGSPAWIPRGVATILLGAALMLLWKALSGKSLSLPERISVPDRNRVLWIAVLTGIYVVAIERLGFLAGTIPYLFGFSFVLGERRWVRLVLFAVIAPVTTYLIFDKVLNVPLPRGLFR